MALLSYFICNKYSGNWYWSRAEFTIYSFCISL
jgi:heat shock protein HslJ